MLIKKSYESMGSSNLGWLQSKFHFSFSDYYNPLNMQFGKLRVVNDDTIAPGTGFDTHPHRNMEIITYVTGGELTHKDSMGNQSTLKRGEVQYMSAGTLVTHSEYNLGKEPLTLFQIWILPDALNHTPNYGEHKFKAAERTNKLLHMVSSKKGDAPIKINQDVNFYTIELAKDKNFNFKVSQNRQCYLVQIEGSSEINNIHLNPKDALASIEEDLNIKPVTNSHFLFIEMAKSKV